MHNGVVTEISKLTPKECEEYYKKNPISYYQQYVKASVSPAYNLILAALGASEEFMEFICAYQEDNIADIASEGGDLLFQLYNIANWSNIDMCEVYKHIPYRSNVSIIKLEETFGELIGTIMKVSRYSDPSYFQKKWGMTAEERVMEKLAVVISYMIGLCNNAGMDLKYVMDHNLRKLDERHAEHGYYFSAGLGNTIANGSSINR